ncbi:MAG: GNAT family N-acetyltransferase [Actinomycetota bacterium]
MTDLSVTPCRSRDEWSLAASVVTEYLDWLGQASGVGDVAAVQPKAAAERTNLASVYGGPDDAFFLARREARAVGVVGVLRVDARSVEIARLYVRPAARAAGAGRRLVTAALDHARRVGAERVVLDTHGTVMPRAVDLYRTFGFVTTDEPSAIPVRGALRMVLPLAA